MKDPEFIFQPPLANRRSIRVTVEYGGAMVSMVYDEGWRKLTRYLLGHNIFKAVLRIQQEEASREVKE